MITWRPIAELPDELKDGREVMAWCSTDEPQIVHWNELRRYWQNDEGQIIDDLTHFAEINAPEEQFSPANPARFTVVPSCWTSEVEVVPVSMEYIAPTVEQVGVSFHISGKYRAALEAVEPGRNVRVKDGGRIVWEGTAGELLAIADAP